MGEFKIDYKLYNNVNQYSEKMVLVAGGIRFRSGNQVLTKFKNCEMDEGYRGFDLVIDMFKILWSVTSILDHEQAINHISGDSIEGDIEDEAFQLIRMDDKIIFSIVGFDWKDGDYRYYHLEEDEHGYEGQGFQIPEREYYTECIRAGKSFYREVLLARGIASKDWGINFYNTVQETEQKINRRARYSY